MFEDKDINKKRKTIKKVQVGSALKTSAKEVWIPLDTFDTFKKLPADFKEVSRFTVQAV